VGDTGHHHYLTLVDRLLDARGIVDADLTDVTAGELVALVARYLAHQEAIDVRIKIAPPLDDPRWQQIQAGPDGQLYDVAATSRLCRRLIDVMLGRDEKKKAKDEKKKDEEKKAEEMTEEEKKIEEKKEKDKMLISAK
jgi:hypothetical protein